LHPLWSDTPSWLAKDFTSRTPPPPYYVIFCTFLLLSPLRPRLLPQRLILQLGSSLSMRDQISLKLTEHAPVASLLMKLACRLSATEISVEMGWTLRMFFWGFTVSVHRFLHSPTFRKSFWGAGPNWIATALLTTTKADSVTISGSPCTLTNHKSRFNVYGSKTWLQRLTWCHSVKKFPLLWQKLRTVCYIEKALLN
jgi:hypothetical protein